MANIKVKVQIKGCTPLLMCAFQEEQLNNNGIRDKELTTKEQAEKYVYRNKKGELYIPGNCIFAAIIEAGKFLKSGKSKVTTQKSSLIPAGIAMLTDECLLGVKDFEVDSRSVVIPATGGRIMKYRPRLDEWKTSFVLDIDTKEFSTKTVYDLVRDAGYKCGLLSYRPSRKGWFGRFDIVKFEEIK